MKVLHKNHDCSFCYSNMIVMRLIPLLYTYSSTGQMTSADTRWHVGGQSIKNIFKIIPILNLRGFSLNSKGRPDKSKGKHFSIRLASTSVWDRIAPLLGETQTDRQMDIAITRRNGPGANSVKLEKLRSGLSYYWCFGFCFKHKINFHWRVNKPFESGWISNPIEIPSKRPQLPTLL